MLRCQPMHIDLSATLRVCAGARRLPVFGNQLGRVSGGAALTAHDFMLCSGLQASSELERELQSESAMRRSAQRGYTDLQHSSADLQRSNADLQRSNANLQRSNEDLQRSNADLQRDVDKLRAQLTHLEVR